jgi:hypothetical protein
LGSKDNGGGTDLSVPPPFLIPEKILVDRTVHTVSLQDDFLGLLLVNSSFWDKLAKLNNVRQHTTLFFRLSYQIKTFIDNEQQ